MKQNFLSLRSTFREHPELWFFVFANVVFLIMYGWSLSINPQLLNPGWFLLFTTLTLIHIALHWTLLLIGEKPQWFWPYVLAQGILVFTITYLSQNMGMIFALYLALIGEIIGASQRKSWLFLASIFLLFLSLVNFILLMGINQALWWIVGTIPMIVFVVLYVSVFTGEARAKEQAQSLLKELEVAHSQLAEYANQVEQLTLSTERQRMARELHDTLAQGLAGLILQLEAVDSRLSSGDTQKAQTIVQQAMTRARSTLADARRAIGDLREDSSPTDLNKAILAEAERFQHTTGIPCSLDLCLPTTLPPQVGENALRAVSEGLMNIARHAEASKADILIGCDDQYLWIEIQDNGIGFDPGEKIGRSGHFGLLGMRERARLSGGSLSIESSPAVGTTVRLQLPLSETP